MQIYKNIDILLFKLMLIILIFVSNTSFSQSDNLKLQTESEFILQNFNKLKEEKSDSLKIGLNIEIENKFEEILDKSGSFEYNFDTLKNYVSILYSDDNLLKIYTWGTFFSDGTYKYYGFIQHRNKKKEAITVYKLTDKSDEIENPENEILSNDNWFGAVYYELITTKDGKKKIYTLLGWDGNNDFSNKKIIDVLTFSGSEKPKFGLSFNIEEKKSKRVIFEFNKLATMSLKYNPSIGNIIYDHLSPSEPKFEGVYRFYGPDFSYDGLYFDDGVWLYMPDLDIRNDKE